MKIPIQCAVVTIATYTNVKNQPTFWSFSTSFFNSKCLNIALWVKKIATKLVGITEFVELPP